VFEDARIPRPRRTFGSTRLELGERSPPPRGSVRRRLRSARCASEGRIQVVDGTKKPPADVAGGFETSKGRTTPDPTRRGPPPRWSNGNPRNHSDYRAACRRPRRTDVPPSGSQGASARDESRRTSLRRWPATSGPTHPNGRVRRAAPAGGRRVEVGPSASW